MQSRCVRKSVQVSSRNSCEEGVLQHMTNHYRRILNAKKSIDTSPPYCYQARRPNATSLPTKTSSMINSKNCRTFIGCNVSPSSSARSQSANSYGRSCCMRTTPYVSSSRYHAACVAGGTISPVLVTCVDMDLINCITYDTKKGPAAYCDKGWEEVKATSNNRKFLPTTSLASGKIKPCKAKENFISHHKMYNGKKVSNQTGKSATVTKDKKPGQRRAVSPKEEQTQVTKDQKLPKRLPFSAEEKVILATKNQKLPQRLPFSSEANLAPVSRDQEPQKVPAVFSEEKLPLSPTKKDSKESRKLLSEEKIPTSVGSSHSKQKRSLSTEEKLALPPEKNDFARSHPLHIDEKIPPSIGSSHSKQKRSLSTEEKLALSPERNDSTRSRHLSSDEKVYQAVVSILSKDRRSLSSEEKQPPITASNGSTSRRSLLSDEKIPEDVAAWNTKKCGCPLKEKLAPVLRDKKSQMEAPVSEKEDLVTINRDQEPQMEALFLEEERPAPVSRHQDPQMEARFLEEEDPVRVSRNQEPQKETPISEEQEKLASPRRKQKPQMKGPFSEEEKQASARRKQQPRVEAPYSEEERPAPVSRHQEPEMEAPFSVEERRTPLSENQYPQKVPLSSSEEKLPRSTPSSNSKESGVLWSEEKLPLSPAKKDSKESHKLLSEKIPYAAARSRSKQKRSLPTEEKLALPPERSDSARCDEKVYRGKAGRVFKEKRSLSSEEKKPPSTEGNDSMSRRTALSEEKISYAEGNSYSQQMRTFSKAEKLHLTLLRNNAKQSHPHLLEDKMAHDTVCSHPKSKHILSSEEKSSHIVYTNRSTSSKQKGKTIQRKVHPYVCKDSQCTCSSTGSSEDQISASRFCSQEKDPRAMHSRCYQNLSADSLEENLIATDKVRTRSKSSCVTSPNLSTSSKIVKNEVESKLRSSRVYHPPRRRSRAKIETESFRPMTESPTSSCKCMTICICGSDDLDSNLKKNEEGSRKESQTSSRDSAYNGGVASLPDSRSPTPDKSYKKSHASVKDFEHLLPKKERGVKETEEEEEEAYSGSLIESSEKAVDDSFIVSEKAESVIDDDQEVLITEKDYDNFSSKIESSKEAGIDSKIHFKAKPEDLKRPITGREIESQKEVPVCDFEIKTENAKPNRESLREIKEETMYLRFIQNITSEIIEKCLYTNKSLNKVMKRHLINNLQTLDKERMVKEVNNLRIRLGVPEDKSFLNLDVGVVESASSIENCQQLLSDSAFVVPSDIIAPLDFLTSPECLCGMENENEKYAPWEQNTGERRQSKEPSSQINFVHEIIHYPLQQESSIRMGLPMVKMKTTSHSDDFDNTESRERDKTFEAWEIDDTKGADLEMGFSTNNKGDPNSRDWVSTSLQKKDQRVTFYKKNQIRKNTMIDEQGSANSKANKAHL